jgi:omega-6 fatty acid desaturase (delta-12 desaturase)
MPSSPALQVRPSYQISEIRKDVAAHRHQHTAVGIILFLSAVLAYITSFIAAVVMEPIWSRIIVALALGPLIALLFRIAHDAGHGCHFPHRLLNQIVGNIAILPSYHPYRVWRLFHNGVHHAFTNHRDRDYIWVPLSYEEYSARNSLQRLVTRVHRTIWGVGFYYLTEIWAGHMIFPGKTVRPRLTPSYVADSLFALGFALLQVLAIIILHQALGRVISVQSLAVDISIAMIVPFLILNWLLGYVSFLNHSHPQVPWFASTDEWSFATGQIRCSVHMSVPMCLIFFITDLGLHATHHLEPRVPIWKLVKAQQKFVQKIHDEGVFEHWSPKLQREIFRQCKLYDYQNHQWLDFSGCPTTRPILSNSPAAR